MVNLKYHKSIISHMKHKIINNEPKIYQSFNATYQGFFNYEHLQDYQQITGEGIVIDDQFNFFLTNWKEDHLHGPTFARLITGQIIIGQFQRGRPQGTIAVFQDKFSLFLAKNQKEGDGWNTDAVLIDNQAKIFYLLELTLRENIVDLDRTQKIGTQTVRSEVSKNPWKIKIIDRCGLKKDGSLSCLSKKLKNINKSITLEYESSSIFTEQQRNHLKLIGSVMGSQLKDPYLISPQLFLMRIAQLNNKIEASFQKEGNEDILFVTLKQENGHITKLYLGLALSLKSGDVKSLGCYDDQYRLSGLGIQMSKRGDIYAGIFKENLLVKEYASSSSHFKPISTFQLRELLQNQHLKSLNCINTTFYLQIIEQIVSTSVRISKYTETFEREYEKRHFSYNDSENSDLSDGAGLNILKYGATQPMELTNQMREMERKRPGFIIKKDQSQEEKEGRSRSPSLREVGKIARYSPSLRSYSPLKSSSRKMK